MQGDNYTGGFGIHILWRKQRVRGEGRERARGDGRQRGNLPVTTSKPPVAQGAGGIPNTNQTPRPKGWWDVYLFIYLLMNLYYRGLRPDRCCKLEVTISTNLDTPAKNISNCWFGPSGVSRSDLNIERINAESHHIWKPWQHECIGLQQLWHGILKRKKTKPTKTDRF